MTWKIKKHDDGLYLYCNLLDIEKWANYFYDFRFALRYDSLNFTQLTDLLYEAENYSHLKFGALTGQDEEISQENKKEIKKYFDEELATDTPPRYKCVTNKCVILGGGKKKKLGGDNE